MGTIDMDAFMQQLKAAEGAGQLLPTLDAPLPPPPPPSGATPGEFRATITGPGFSLVVSGSPEHIAHQLRAAADVLGDPGGRVVRRGHTPECCPVCGCLRTEAGTALARACTHSWHRGEPGRIPDPTLQGVLRDPPPHGSMHHGKP